MRITEVETFVLGNRRVLVKVSTDEGVVGWGEPVLENWARTTVAAVERMSAHLLGRNPLEITRLWQVLARGGFYRGGAVLNSAVAGLDQALWDIKGRWHGVPVHEMLGGPARDRVRVYRSANSPGRTGDPAAAVAQVAAGLTMIKVVPEQPVEFLAQPRFLEEMIEQLHELRSAVGWGVDIAIDLHGRFSVPMSRRLLPRLEPLGVAFVEEPLRPEHTAVIADLVRCSSVPIATGERLYSRAEFRGVLEAGVAVVQPDVSHAGGITECFRVATQAEVYDAVIAPHCPLGPVALAACLQVDLAVPNVLAQEYGLNSATEPLADVGLLRDPATLAIVDGHIPRLVKPGLGIEVDEDEVRARVQTGDLAPGSPVWSGPDGGFAEW